MYFSGCLSNFCLQDSEQKYYVRPLYSDLPDALFSSICILQTGSMTIASSWFCHSSFLRFRRSEFVTTNTDENAMAPEAMMGRLIT